jgi:hypothetical protein
VDLGQLVERAFFIGAESNGRRRHAHKRSTNVLQVVCESPVRARN